MAARALGYWEGGGQPPNAQQPLSTNPAAKRANTCPHRLGAKIGSRVVKSTLSEAVEEVLIWDVQREVESNGGDGVQIAQCR